MDRKVATIQDVARVAGVSTATVSRTLSKPSVVSTTTRDAVLSAIEATGYRPNTMASNLRRQRAGSVIALVPNLANPFFSQIFAGLSSVLTEAGFGLLVADTQTGSDPDERLSHYLTSGMADGLVVFDGTLSPEVLARGQRPPVLMACEWMDGGLPSLTVDNVAGARMAVDHLVAQGHRRIGHIGGPEGNVLSLARVQGYRAAMTKAGLAVRDDWIFEGDFSMDSGAQAGRDWLRRGDRPTALFCASDEMAVGFVGAVHRAGLSVPRDVSVIGFDNIEVVQHLSPALTTIRQPRHLIGARAAEMLLDMITMGSLSGPSEKIPLEFIERDSVTAPQSA
ncbi:LacI family DNA-binding transcriptional regulator [Maritimibacter sp. DP1N21-5]|uniref:LacI family DNA-binding transcriptional regulator n=1 Tax=Maritimibacter sp. DP1N21-5 TaxID=2836867 RepID=UPI001C48B900|nr:LacI family DNA-binding transcriptional regulator [Maritimibacter sp. DP1N21-5]MBV7408411.1 LacI family DNA-binding transcriptional regulator [Maritimibacter sp. DP1N21-5]